MIKDSPQYEERTNNVKMKCLVIVIVTTTELLVINLLMARTSYNSERSRNMDIASMPASNMQKFACYFRLFIK